MTNEQKIIATKLGLLKLAEQLGTYPHRQTLLWTHALQPFRVTKHLAQAKQLDRLFEWQQLKSDIPEYPASDLAVVG